MLMLDFVDAVGILLDEFIFSKNTLDGNSGDKMFRDLIIAGLMFNKFNMILHWDFTKIVFVDLFSTLSSYYSRNIWYMLRELHLQYSKKMPSAIFEFASVYTSPASDLWCLRLFLFYYNSSLFPVSSFCLQRFIGMHVDKNITALFFLEHKNTMWLNRGNANREEYSGRL